jgi:uncharacterized protein (TIGR00290 family)
VTASASDPRYALMWSGGKDSLLALHRARGSGLRVERLVNFHDESGRVRFHATPRELIQAQADAIGLPLSHYATPWSAYEGMFRKVLADLASDGFAGVVFGDIHLADVRAWYEERVRAAGLEHVEPIWGARSMDLVREFVVSGHRAVITCCEEGKLDASWLGRMIDETFPDAVAALPIDPAGENGEYHSFVFDGPLFQRAVRWTRGATTRDGRFLQMELAPAG